MKLTKINSIQFVEDYAPTYFLTIEVENDFGETEVFKDYVLRFKDPYGLAPEIRQAIGWISENDLPVT